MAGVEDGPSSTNTKLLRCMDWLQKQNELVPKKLSLQNQNDIQFIIECNTQRRNFLLSVPEDDTSVPAAVDEAPVKPLKVPLYRLRVENLRMLCEWHECQCYYTDYELFQKHVVDHFPAEGKEDTGEGEHACLWDICNFKTQDPEEMLRHINYHAYHAKLLAIGFNGRATMNLERCKKDSSKRNKLPVMLAKHCCMWVECTATFNSIQEFFNHVKVHVNESEENLCSWAGCGAVFPRSLLLAMHLRSHTAERIIACYHCGRQFSCNRKLRDHLARQNVDPERGLECELCGLHYATEYLLREHRRQHVSEYACSMCDMSAPSPAALAQHVRYRHLPGAGVRCHACPRCDYRAVTKADLRKHIVTHDRKRKKKDDCDSSDVGPSDEEDSDGELKRKKREPRSYACHMCPEKDKKVYSRGARLTKHLVKFHGARWACGYSRFRYQRNDDGIYRLTTTRFEYEDISESIEKYNGPKIVLTDKKLKFDIKEIAPATENTPKRIEVIWTNADEIKNDTENDSKVGKENEKAVEITMCDVDEDGNIISSKIINSDVVYT